MLNGMTLATNGSGVQSIQIGGGACAATTPAQLLAGAGTFYKTLASAWSPGGGTSGSPIGGLGNGSVAANTWYHVFAIGNSVSVYCDYYFDTSLAAAHIPSGFTAYRRIGSVLTDAGKNVRPFHQYPGGWFLWDAPVNDISGASLVATTFTDEVLASVPPGVQTVALILGAFNIAAGNGLWVGPKTVTAVAQYTVIQPVSGVYASTGAIFALTDTSQTVSAYASFACVGSLLLSVQGYQDSRGM